MSSAANPVPFGPDLRSALLAMVRKRVPPSEAEDIVQSALAEAIESPHAPQESEALRRWIFGVAKNKVVDYHRRAGRESFDLPDVPGAAAPHAEADLLRWAEKNLPEGDENQKTLDWMLREGEGEKLESIAASEKLPPPRVRQRVSRLRRHFKENWQREVALLAALGVIISAVLLFLVKKDEPAPITHEVEPPAEPLRRAALRKCASSEWKSCIEGLDEARRIDPAGDGRPEIQRARQAAEDAVRPLPLPSSPPTAAPPLPTSAPPPTAAPSGGPAKPMQKTSTAPPAPVPPSTATPPTKASSKRSAPDSFDSTNANAPSKDDSSPWGNVGTKGGGKSAPPPPPTEAPKQFSK